MAVNYVEHLKLTREDLLWSDHSYYDLGLKSTKAIERQAQELTSQAAVLQPCTYLLIPETVIPVKQQDADVFTEAEKHDHTYIKCNRKRRRSTTGQGKESVHSNNTGQPLDDNLNDLQSSIIVLDEESFHKLHAVASKSSKSQSALSQSALDLCVPTKQTSVQLNISQTDPSLGTMPLSKSCEHLPQGNAVHHVPLMSFKEGFHSNSVSSLVEGLENCQVVMEACDEAVVFDDCVIPCVENMDVNEMETDLMKNDSNKDVEVTVALAEQASSEKYSNQVLESSQEEHNKEKVVLTSKLDWSCMQGNTSPKSQEAQGQGLRSASAEVARSPEAQGQGLRSASAEVAKKYSSVPFANVLSTIQDHTYEEDRFANLQTSIRRDHCYGGGKISCKQEKPGQRTRTSNSACDHNYDMS